MTLPGGPANKLGNRYEKWWTVSEFLRMLGGSTEAIRIEDPGVEKAEFVVTIGSQRELHQAKRSHPNGKWSLASLRGDGLLQSIGEQLAGNEDRFVFASGSDAHELSELCKAASDAESKEEFEQNFIAAKDRKEGFEKLLTCWRCDPPTAVERLKRIEVRPIGERDLEQRVRDRVQLLFLANSEKVKAKLLAIIEDSVHQTWTRRALVEELARRGYSLRQLRSPEHAGVALETATDQYLKGARSKLIQGTLVPRAEAESLVSRLGDTPTDSVLTGRAGSGKTACVIEAVDRLRERGLPVLAFRLDRVPFSSVTTTADLGCHLRLEESPVLVLAAAAETAGNPAALIIDQLDVVSTMSGRSSGAFDLVEELLHEARGARPRAVIHTVVVCRAFDWEHDSRLRQLMPPDSQAQVEIAEFTVDEVKRILADGGFDASLFGERQLELLRLPQNLSLFLEAGFDSTLTPAFSTATELFDRYWAEKRKSVTTRGTPLPDQWMEVIETLCNEMTSAQQLSVPREKLDAIQPDYLDSMASEGVLTFDGRHYGFGHESFFDYCFARMFINRPESLVSFLKESEQNLFRRAQVRQVLAYLRDADRARYVQELGALLSDEGIRTHIKDLAFALLAEVAEPTEEEWKIREEWTAPALKAIEQETPNPDKLSEIAWQRFFTASSWFAITDQHELIESWLASGNDRLADMAVNYLRIHQRHYPDRVAALLEPYADHGGEWAKRLRSFMEWVDYGNSQRFSDLFLRLLDNGTLDQASGPITMNSTFWYWSMLRRNRVESIPEVLAHQLRRHFLAAGEDFGHGTLFGNDSSAEIFEKSAERAPAAFVEHVLPVVLEISDETLLSGKDRPRYDAVWPILIKAEHPTGEEACLTALAKAIQTLAREESEDFHDVISELRRRDTHIANHLLLGLYRGGAARYGDEAVSLLCDEPWRFECGFSDSPNWCAMELIQAVVSHCSAENRQRLETVILRYASPWERTRDGYRQIGNSRFALLSAIPAGLRSTRANAHFEELKRKFGEPAYEPAEASGGIVESPIAKPAAAKMTDDQWLRAIAKYSTNDDLIHHSGDDLKGGARELAQVLETRVQEEPERFANLSLRFPANANPVYLERTLTGLKSVDVASNLKLQVCKKSFEESRGHCGKSIADVLGSIKDPLPDDPVRMLHWLATEHEDPPVEEWRDTGGRRIHRDGINTTRGRAADAIRDLILIDAAYVDRFRSTLERMILDRNPSVLSCVAGALRAVEYRDPAFGMSLFLRMNLSEDRLLATDHVWQFIRANLRDNFSELRPIIERMLRSSEPEVCDTGGVLAGIATLELESAADLADEALHGDSRQRLGVAKVAAANIAVPEYRTRCAAMLVKLFNDDDAEVRREAASCFRKFPDGSLETYGELIEAFCDSRAYEEDSFSILHALEESLGRLPGMTCLVCDKFFDRFGDEASDIQTGRSGDARTVAKLIFRTYQQHQDDKWTSRSLDLIDRLCLERIYHAASEFEQFER